MSLDDLNISESFNISGFERVKLKLNTLYGKHELQFYKTTTSKNKKY